jgi:hypothetical protein
MNRFKFCLHTVEFFYIEEFELSVQLGRAVAQAVSSRLLTAAAWVQA